MILTIALVRHGRTEGNVNFLMSGHTDHQLTQEGIDELLSLKQEIQYPSYQRLYSSDLSRAIHTAEILFDEKVLETHRRFGLREINFGDLENVYYLDIIKPFYQDFFGESPLKYRAENGPMFQERVIRELKTICLELVNDQLDRAMIVAHAGTIRMIHFTLLNLPQKNYRDLEVDNGKGFVFKIDYDPTTHRIELIDFQTIGE